MSNHIELKNKARAALDGKWAIAVLAGFIVTILGGQYGFFTVNVKIPVIRERTTSHSAGISLSELPDILLNTDDYMQILLAFAGISVIVLLLIVIALTLVFSVIRVGHSRFNLDLLEGETAPSIGTLFSYFQDFIPVAGTMLLQGIYASLWSLLFIIPGIVKSYSYAMTSYILAENPRIGANEAITLSRRMMDGNKLRLFLLQLSFFGWSIICALTLGIGYYWLFPYASAAEAAFYQKVKNADISENNSTYENSDNQIVS